MREEYVLKLRRSYVDTFRKGKYVGHLEYKVYSFFTKDGESVLYSSRISGNSVLNGFLTSVLGADKEIELKREDIKIFYTAFKHSRSWSIYKKAWAIKDEEGLAKSLKFLREKMSIFYLNDALEGKNGAYSHFFGRE